MDEILVPPYPTQSVNIGELYDYLQQAFDWIAQQEYWANEEAVRLEAPMDPFIIDLSEFANFTESDLLDIPIPLLYAIWDVLRMVRRRFDDIVRNHESESLWETDRCIHHRIVLVHAAAYMLYFSLASDEERKSRIADYMKMVEGEVDNSTKLDDEELDRLFNPDHYKKKDEEEGKND